MAEAIAAIGSVRTPAGTITLDVLSRHWVLAASAACLLPLLLQLPPKLALGIATIAIAAPVLARNGDMHTWLRVLLSMAVIGVVLVLHRFAFGRDTGCALLAAMLALKPVEMRGLRDARSLLGFVLFAPFATFLLDQGPLSLVLGLIGAASALAAMMKLSDYESGETSSSRTLMQRLTSVFRLVAIGLPVALVTFWLFPRISTPLWGVPERILARPGLSDRMSPGEWIDLITDDTPALRATFFGDTPPQSDMYWRGPVMWDFDGHTWTTVSWSSASQQPIVVPGNKTYDYELEVEPTERAQMIALELPLSAPSETRLDRDYSLHTPRPLSSLTRWRMRSAPPAAFETELHPALRAKALRLPPAYNPRTLALAQTWRREAGNRGAESDAAIANRTLRWIRAEFVYTLETPLLGKHNVDEFLFDYKAGFCEHYSSAFVVLMRAAGVPARVVTGYVGGYRNPIGEYWLVRRSDAHAWTEIWLEGRGWVRVDPTAAVAPERIYDTLDDRATGTFGALGAFAPVLDIGDWMRRGWNDFVLGFNAMRQLQLLQSLGVPDASTRKLVAFFVIATVLALAGMLWLTARQERERDPVLRAWRRVERRYRRMGLGREPHEPVSHWVSRVIQGRPEAKKLISLSQYFSDWRYARDHGGMLSSTALIRELRRFRP